MGGMGREGLGENGSKGQTLWRSIHEHRGRKGVGGEVAHAEKR